MVISHKNKYLFVELPRTGTTAIHDELIKNYLGEDILFKHATYRDFLKTAREEEKKYFVFSCIRNPMDRAVSLFLKLKNPSGQFKNVKYRKLLSPGSVFFNRQIKFIQKHSASFSEYFKKFYIIPYDDWSRLDHHRFDYILRFENLNEDFTNVLRILGINKKRDLPWLNKTIDKNEYIRYFTPDIYERAFKIFGPFMKKYNYSFPEEWGVAKISKWDFLSYEFWGLIRKYFWLHFKTSRLTKNKVKYKAENSFQMSKHYSSQ